MLDHDLRRGRIGGSEVAAIFGDDDFGKDGFAVWYDKKGGGERRRPDLRMTLGKLLEPGILQLYTYLTGRLINHHDRTILDPARPYMAATPDALCAGERRGVDAKLVFWDQRRLWGENPNEIPHRVVMQAWWYMAAFDYDVWDICALVGMDDPRVYTIERDREAERQMLDYVERWHGMYIVGDAIPPVGRTAQAAEYLQRLYPTHKRPDLREAEGDELALLSEYLHLLLDDRAIKARKSEIAIALKAAIKEREGLNWPAEGAKFTWRRCKDSVEINWEAIARGLINEYLKDNVPMQETLIGLHTRTVEGQRRIRMDHPALRKGGAKSEEEQEVAA